MCKLTFLEWLEFICRIGFMRFHNSEMESISLAEKLTHVLDIMFDKCLGCERIKEMEEDLLSESDDDY
jgi:hypothetical protein